jgi:hypothetical protein
VLRLKSWAKLVAFFCVIFPLSARAETVRLDYGTPPGCPDVDSFRRAIESRARRPVSFRDTDYSLWLRVTIRTQEDRVVGVLESTDLGGERPARDVDGANCQTVADALALVAALAIAPEDEDPVVPEPKRKPAPPIEEPNEPDSERNTTDSRSTWRTRVGIGVGTLSGVAPVVLIAGVLPVALEAPRAGIWSPEFGIMPMSAETGVVGTTSNAGNFAFVAFRTEACPLRFAFWNQFALRPCAAFQFGTLHADGSSLGTPVESRRAWAAVGPTGHLRVELSSWFLDIGGAVMFPLLKTRYIVEDRLGFSFTLHETATATLESSLALGLHFSEP